MAPVNHQPHILALETSAGIGSVALAAGPHLLREQPFTAALRHAGELLPLMDRLTRAQGWQPRDIDQLYLSAGPGSFTGLRIAVAVAKALSFALPRVKIVAVPSTDALVLNAHDARTAQPPLHHVAVVIDAKRLMVYAALYEKTDDDPTAAPTPPTVAPPAQAPDDPLARELHRILCDGLVPGFRLLRPAAALPPEQLLAEAPRPLYVLGPGLTAHREAFTAQGVLWLPQAAWQPRAAAVHSCGWRRAQAGRFTDPNLLLPIYLRRPEAVERWEKLHGQDPP